MESLIFPAKSVKSLFDRLENESRNHSVESSGGDIIELSKIDMMYVKAQTVKKIYE